MNSTSTKTAGRPAGRKKTLRTFKLPPDLWAQIVEEASKSQRTRSAIVEAALSQFLTLGPEERDSWFRARMEMETHPEEVGGGE